VLKLLVAATGNMKSPSATPVPRLALSLAQKALREEVLVRWQCARADEQLMLVNLAVPAWRGRGGGG
jgi:hypothetical protein